MTRSDDPTRVSSSPLGDSADLVPLCTEQVLRITWSLINRESDASVCAESIPDQAGRVVRESERLYGFAECESHKHAATVCVRQHFCACCDVLAEGRRLRSYLSHVRGQQTGYIIPPFPTSGNLGIKWMLSFDGWTSRKVQED